MLNILAAVVLVTATKRQGSIFPDAYGKKINLTLKETFETTCKSLIDVQTSQQTKPARLIEIDWFM